VDYPYGECFFHYTTRGAAFEAILPEKQLRLSPYHRVSDPLENQPWRFAGAWFVDEADQERPEREFFVFHGETDSIWHSAKLLALTVDAPGATGFEASTESFARGWARARMWEGYAERHRGVCLVFDQAKLTASIERSLEAQGLAGPYHKPVVYTPEGPDLPPFDPTSVAGGVTAEYVREFVEHNHEELFFRKATDWETEYEYRFVVTAPDRDFAYVDYGDALQAVVVGERFPRWQRAGAIELCQEVEAEALRLDWSMRRPFPVRLGVRHPATGS
jgi:hypothetical protein